MAVASHPVELYEEPRARKLARTGLWTGLASVVLLGHGGWSHRMPCYLRWYATRLVRCGPR